MKNEMNEKNVWKSITVIAVLLSVIAIAMTGAVSAKSVYLVADHHASPTPINAYNIGPAGCCDLAYQATYSVASHVLGASGLAMYEDPNGDGDFSDAQILVTYESSNAVEVFNAVNFQPVKTITAIGAYDLAGIVVDQEKKLVYTVDRYTQNLYVYDANTFAPVGTLPIVLGTLSTNYGAVGLALDETNDWLFVTDFTPTVHYFDTNTWAEVGTITTGNTYAIGIAYDEDNELVYTGGAFVSDYLLCKYDMTTSTSSCVDLSQMVSGMGAMGLAVDSDSYCLYVTTGYYGDDLRVFDSTLTQLCVYPDTEGQILNPAGICIPRGEISYNPLHLSKDDGLADDDCVVVGGTITYDICYDNTANTNDVHNVSITDTMPAEVSFVSATDGGVYDSSTHTVTWDIGTVLAGAAQQCVQLTVQVDTTATPGSTITNSATIESDETLPITVKEETEVCPNQPPDVSEAYPSEECLWPPNHKFVDITIEGVTDPDGDEVTITITKITSDEPTATIEGAGGDNPAKHAKPAIHAPDADGVGTDTASVRAERSGTGNGRVYEITFVASDGIAETEGSVKVCVPHDYSGKCVCAFDDIDDGQHYDATEIN